jgi:hypothetical protein
MAGITLKIEGLDRMIDFTDPKMLAKATRAGIAKAGGSIKTQVGKAIGERYDLRAARIKEDIGKAVMAPDGLSATVVFKSRPPTLTQFNMKPGTRSSGQPGLGRGMGWGKPTKPGRPLTARVIKSDGRRSYKGAFVFIGKNGNQVVGRKDGQGKIYSVLGPSIASVFGGQGRYAAELRANAQRLIGDEFIKGFEKKLGDIARGYGGR